MSQFLPETPQSAVQQTDFKSIVETPSLGGDIALMQRIFSAAVTNPSQIPSDFMAYLVDFIQTQRLSIPIGQVVGYQRFATQVITDFRDIPSPADGQIVLLRVGASAPYTYVQMMFDQAAQQWVSEQFSFASANNSSNLAAPETKTYTSSMSWAPVHVGGLTMQLRWAGTLQNSGGSANTAHAGVTLSWAQLTGGGSTSAQIMDATNPNVGTTIATGVDWTNVSDPGAYDVVTGGMYSYTSSNINSNTASIIGGCVGRYVKAV